MSRKGRIALAASPLALLAAAFGLRLALAPAESSPPPVDLSPPARARLAARARASEVPAETWRADLAAVDILLVGEEHFYREPKRFLCELLEAVEGRRVQLLLELPAGVQPQVDEDRMPIGARLLQAGVPRARIRSVLLSGQGRVPLDQAWPGPGILAMSGAVGAEDWGYFIDYPVFRAVSGRELFDHFVHLGPLERLPR